MWRVAATASLFMAAAQAGATECVVLLHGLARTSASMESMAEALREAGYTTANIDYPSRDYRIEQLAEIAVPEGLDRCREHEGIETIHFVTHSLGGILLRQYLSVHDIDELGRVVMLAPPNQGSDAADKLSDVPGFDWVNGPAGKQLGKGADSVPLALGPADFELGIIGGTRSVDPLGSSVLPDPEDGKVSVEDTHLQGMTDFAVVNHSHAFIMRTSEPIELTLRFLQTGSFKSVDRR